MIAQNASYNAMASIQYSTTPPMLINPETVLEQDMIELCAENANSSKKPVYALKFQNGTVQDSSF